MSKAHLPSLGRRALLLGLGASFALPGVRLAFAKAPGPARLVVVLLRGGLDGLYAVQPYADPHFAELRGPLALPEPERGRAFGPWRALWPASAPGRHPQDVP